MRSKPSALSLLLLWLLAGLAAADRITLVDGTEIKDVRVKSESLSAVTYDAGKKKGQTIAAARVRSVQYERLPKLVDEALAALKDGDTAGCVEMLDEYVGKRAAKGDPRFPFGPAFAGWTALHLRQRFGDLAGVVEKAASFAEHFPDSRYLPMVFLLEADAQRQIGKAGALDKTLDSFRELISERGLSKRWALEADLAQARGSEKSLSKRKSALESIVAAASRKYPSVASRAKVAVGEALLAQADKSVADQDAAHELREQARVLFLEIAVKDEADGATLAGAYTGLGECLFYAGAKNQDQALLKQALRALLRVPVLFEGQSAYVPKALFLAGRSFDMLQDGKRRGDMRRQLERLFPNSPWTAQAKKVLN